MKRFLSITFLNLWAFAVCGQQMPATQGAWLDSLKSQTYIGMELWLDDLVVNQGNSKSVTNDQDLRNTDEFLHHLSGVKMIRRGSFANEPMLRGLTSDRYVMSVDGMRVFGACTDKMDPASSYIEPVNLRSLDVTFGGESGMNGSGTGGAIDFKLKKAVFNADRTLMGSFGSSFSSVSNAWDQSGDLNFSKNNMAIRVSGVHRKAENYENGAGEEVKYSQYEKLNYATSLSYKWKTHLFNFDFLGDDARDVGYPALPMDVSSAKAKLFGLTYLSDQLLFLNEPELKVYYNQVHHVMDDTKRDSVAMHMDMPGFNHTLGAFVKGNFWENSNSRINWKLDYYQHFAHAEMTMYPNESQYQEMFMLTWPDIHRMAIGNEMAYFVRFNEMNLTAGGRIELSTSGISSEFGERQLSVFGKTGMEGRQYLLHNLSIGINRKIQNAEFGAKLASAQRLPSTSEQFGFYLFNRQDGYDYLGDPDLKKEHNLHAELNYSQSGERFKLKTSLFSYYFTNYIMGIYDPSLSVMTAGARGVKWYTNTSHARMLGGELAVSYVLATNRTVSLGVNSVFGWDYENAPLPQMPPVKINLLTNQPLWGFNLKPEWIWSAAQYRTSEKFNEQQTKSFHLINVHLEKQVKWGENRLLMNAGVDNLLNAAYREHFDIGQVLRPGRSIIVQVKMKF